VELLGFKAAVDRHRDPALRTGKTVI
jgi:hypothetical protein